MKTKIDKIGFEIEGEMDSALTNTLSDFGSIHSDGSLRSCRGKHSGHSLYCQEFVTPPIEYKDIKSAKKIFNTFLDAKNRKGFHWNKSMGFHIHVSFHPTIPSEIFSTQFTEFFSAKMKAKWPSTFNRRAKNSYCQAGWTDESIMSASTSRYKAINFMPAHSRHGTIEFRIFPASYPTRMYLFLRFTLNCIEEFLTQKIKAEFSFEVEDSEVSEEIEDGIVLNTSPQSLRASRIA